MKRALAATGTCLLLFAATTFAGGEPRTTVESKTSSGAIASGSSDLGDVSPNGRYATFWSSAANLPGTAGGTIDQVFLRDRQTGKVKLISKTTAGAPADDTSEDSSVSANGKRVVFESAAGNLPGGVAGDDQVYVRDLKTGRTKRVSKTSAGAPADNESFDASISANGRFVVFESDAANLPGALAGETQAYVHDLKRGKTRLLSRTSAGAPGDATSGDAAISANGRVAAFESEADNLPGALGTGEFQVYVRLLKKGKTRLVSKSSSGVPANSDSFDPLISDNGRHVGFTSDADNLPGSDGSFEQAFLHDRKAKKTALVSRTSAGDPATGDSGNGYPSNDGRYVVFESDAGNLPGDFTQIYLRDRKRDRTKLISQSNAGEAASDGADTPRNRVLAARSSIAFFDASGDNLPGLDNQVFSRKPVR
jgi:Tol biopolymer transport system component